MRLKSNIVVLGEDQNDDNSSYEASTAAETAIDGSMVFTYTIDDDDPIPNAFFKNIDGVTDSEGGEIEEGDSSKEITIALSSAAAQHHLCFSYLSGLGGCMNECTRHRRQHRPKLPRVARPKVQASKVD